MPEELGEFEELDEDGKQTAKPTQHVESSGRVRIPREGQMVGTVTQRFGGNRMEIACADGKTRNCRVPGRFRRSLWLRLNDVVLIELWEYDKDTGDVIYKYNPSEVNQLRKRGLLTQNTDQF